MVLHNFQLHSQRIYTDYIKFKFEFDQFSKTRLKYPFWERLQSQRKLLGAPREPLPTYERRRPLELP